jgi:hypothetical protein
MRDVSATTHEHQRVIVTFLLADKWKLIRLAGNN